MTATPRTCLYTDYDCNVKNLHITVTQRTFGSSQHRLNQRHEPSYNCNAENLQSIHTDHDSSQHRLNQRQEPAYDCNAGKLQSIHTDHDSNAKNLPSKHTVGRSSQILKSKQCNPLRRDIKEGHKASTQTKFH